MYIGLCETCIKERIRNHYKAFNDEERRYVKDTALSTYIWQLKDSGVTDYSIKWSIVGKPPNTIRLEVCVGSALLKKLLSPNLKTKVGFSIYV